MEAEDDDKEDPAEAKREQEFEEAVAKHEIHRRRWSGSWEWLRIKPAGVSDGDKGTVLAVGYYIDSLAALMFVMVTFVASLIHLFSIGYMSDEKDTTVEDHQVHGEDGGPPFTIRWYEDGRTSKINPDPERFWIRSQSDVHEVGTAMQGSRRVAWRSVA